MYATGSARRTAKYSTIFISILFFWFFYGQRMMISSGDRDISLRRISMTEPNVAHPLRRPKEYDDSHTFPRINATILSLVRNEELEGIVSSMRQVEASWNSKFNYPWTFFNNVPFTEEFKRRTQAETKAECKYELIPSEHWNVPAWIDENTLEESVQSMSSKRVKYASKISYHQMCRWYSGFFYKHPALKDIQYYWRVEPNIKLFCDINYDVFRYMADNNKTYGFTINIYDDPNTLPSLWPETLKFLSTHPEYLHEHNSLDWLTDSSQRPDKNRMANGYSTCHFWSNFEIADMEFWRSEIYEAYFQHLDHANGFFYERWGDAPVHSIALGLFEDTSKIHWFRDIGYQHTVFSNCPDSSNCSGCRVNRMAPVAVWLHKEDCRVNWFKQVCKNKENGHGNLCL
ncbi:family 15 glycosyltransferase [Xylogone sp. PMI_703]|nr:family 15 glycosyltransferase [Xylogone sp. PMI_703]